MNPNLSHYHVDLPYPTVEAGCKNPLYGAEMLSNVGGQNSEMSAVSLYFYNNLVAECQAVSEAFHYISIVEMHHLEIYGQLARQLGADPRLWSRGRNQMIYWSPSYNRYPVSLPQLLRNAIQGEKEAIAKYRKQASWIKNDNIVENLNRIILDEERHLEIMDELYQTYAVKQ